MDGMSCEQRSYSAWPSGARRLRLGRGTGAHPARAVVVVVVAGLVATAGVVTGADPASFVVLPLGIGLAVGWAAGRRDPRHKGAHQRLEAELHLLIRELRESRARPAHVADAERRRIERELHDGCQQRLIALCVKLTLVGELVGGANESVLALIQEISEDAQFALEELHALVHGIYPSLLVDRGLADPSRQADVRRRCPSACVPRAPRGVIPPT
jgi:signal transduction histidine kinase